MLRYAFPLMLMLVCASNLQARTLYVDASTKEAGTGTALRPYRLIQNALNRLQPGVTVKIAPGTYREMLSVYRSGSRDEPIVIEAWKKESPVIDGSFYESGRHKALLQLSNVSHIKVKGLVFKNFKSSSSVHDIYGVLVEGEGENILFENCEISGIQSPSLNSNSAAFAAQGRKGNRPLLNLQVTGIAVHSCSGIGAAISLRGNVVNPSIDTAHIHKNQCSGIELLGNRGVCDSVLMDMPREGVIRKSYLHHLHQKSMSGDQFKPASAIIADSVENILIEACRVQSCDAGIELLASRKGLGLKNATLRNNWIQENESSGIILGAKDYQAGKSETIRLFNNTLVENDQAGHSRGEIWFRYHVDNCVIKNNLFIPEPLNEVSHYIGQLSKKHIPNILIMSHNFYAKRGDQAIWHIGFSESVGYATWMKRGFDRESQWGELLFDKNGLPHSFAQIRDKADGSVSQSSEDVDGNPRVIGLGLDIGAKEW